MRRLFEFMAVLTVAALMTTGAEAKRVALVIGNDKYEHLQALEKAVADANTYAGILRDQGFDEVMLKTDLTRAETDEAFATFLDLIEPGDMAVFAYSGHGWSDGTQNYLVAVDAPAGGRQEFLARISIPLRNGANGILDDIDRRGAGLKVAIIDACRDNPFAAPAGTRSVGLSRGLTRIEPPSGTFVVFSAGTNQEALDRLSPGDPDPNSVFTRVFAPLMKSGLPLQEATKEAQEQVVALARLVKHEQRPAYYDEVLGKACLAGACPAASVADKPATPVDDTAAAYQAALALNTLPAWEAFLKYHPEGFYADLAQAARKKLGFEAIAKLNLPASKPPVEDDTRPVKLPPLDALLPAASMSAIDECDRLTAVILDPDKPVTLAGRGTRKPDEGPEAINACRAAVDAHPDVRRFKTQLAFALLPTKRFDEARKLLEEAAAAGHATAMRGIGFGYFYGTSYTKDQAEGVRWFEKAAAAGDPVGYWYLAFAHYYGNGVAEDKAKAVQLLGQALPILERASDAGDPDAPSELAQIHFGSLGFPPDADRAAVYLAQGFDRGSRFAAQVFTTYSAHLSEKDRTRVEQRLADAGFSPGTIDGSVDEATTAALQKWMDAPPPAAKVASLAPAAAAAPTPPLVTDCDRLAAVMFDPEKPAGLRGVDRAVNDGRVQACRQAIADHPEVLRFKTYLGMALLSGETLGEAVALLKEAAEAGHPAAMFGLAMSYIRGSGTEKNTAEGLRLLEKSIDSGYWAGLIGMAYVYWDGEGDVAKDEAKSRQAIERALPFLERAAAAGDPDAPAVLASLYIEGKVVPGDAGKAAPLFLDGFKRHSTIAVDTLRHNADSLPEETRQAAEKILADAGFSPGPVDGVVDDQTKTALDAWAKDANPPMAGEPAQPNGDAGAVAGALSGASPARVVATEGEAGEAEKAELYQARDGEPGIYTDGTVTWRLVYGGEAGPTVEAKAEIPDRHLSIKLSITRNTDATIPASHIFAIDLAGELGEQITEVPGIAMDESGGSVEELAGAATKVSGGLFWFALPAGESDVAKNLALLRDKPLLNIHLWKTLDERMIVSLTKGASGQRVLEQALAAWSSVAKKQ